MVQVYAVVFERSGRFLIATKLSSGYYFENIVETTSGISLNGGGRVALPGGKLKQFEETKEGAARELKEETSYVIDMSTACQATLQQPYFQAAYFLVDTGTLESVVSSANEALVNSMKIVNAIKSGMIAIKTDITSWANGNNLPSWPIDNELASVSTMNVNNQQEWLTIQSWNNDQVIGWYYTILSFLKNNIIPNLPPN